jgi:hypothetical protein
MAKLEQHKIYNVLCKKPFKLWNLRSWVHLIIRVVDKSSFDHVGFIFYENGRWMQAEATTGRVRIMTFKNWYKVCKTRAWIQENQYATFKRKYVIDYAYQCEGVTKYDFLGLIWMFIWIKRKVWFGPKNPRTQKDRQFCSEFLFNAMGTVNAQKKTPKDAFLAGKQMMGFLAGFSHGMPIIYPNVKHELKK